jgi:hypothetical protein
MLQAPARDVADQIDLDQRVPHEQARAADGGPRRRDLEVPLPHGVEAVEVVQVGQEDLGLHHVIERRARRLEGLGQIPQHVFGLQLDVRAVVRKARMPLRLGRHAGLEITRKLSRREHQIARHHGLGVVGEGPRRVRLDRPETHPRLHVTSHDGFSLDFDETKIQQEGSVDFSHSLGPQGPEPANQATLVDRADLIQENHGVDREASFTRSHEHLGGIRGFLELRGNCRDDGDGTATIRGVVLDDHGRASLLDLCPYRRIEAHQKHLPAPGIACSAFAIRRCLR